MVGNSVSIIQARVGAEIRRGAVIDVYKLASVLEGDCRDLSVDMIARIVSESVILGHGNAVWNKHSVN